MSTSLLGSNRARDGLNMACIVHGITYEELPEQVVIGGGINTNSPRLLDGPRAGGLIELARAGQAVIVTPFTLAGAMAPVTVIGAITQQNAEALAGIVLTQLVGPGSTCRLRRIYFQCGYAHRIPCIRYPGKNPKASLITGQLCRRYQIPFRSSNTNASTSVDAQSAYESEMSLWGAIMGHPNRIAQGGGWLEGGLVASFEKLIIDVEMMQMMAEFVEPLAVTRKLSPSRRCERCNPADTILVRLTPWNGTTVPSIRRWSRTGPTSRTGKRLGVWTRPSGPTPSGNKPSETMSSRPWIRLLWEKLEDYVERRKRELIDADAVLR
ncbi:MAG: hypothetical protein Ct9H300mP16_06520 [Pseudomonadota bacterium]|nr:MAG: hypothetical protein Ct9H300mP16_06520 [Pseudomonadota bacterium]